MTLVLILRPIDYDPARREDEVFDEPAPDTDRGFRLGAKFPRSEYPYRTAETQES